MGELSLIGPEARRVAGAGALGPRRARQRARREIGGHDGRARRHRPRRRRLLRRRGHRGACAARCSPPARPRWPRPPRSSCASSPAARATASTSTTNVIPQEAGLNERAVSFTKGCYVGQETVARLFYRGKPNRHLRGLKLSAPVEPGTPLRLGEKEVGRAHERRRLPRPRPDRPRARAPPGRARRARSRPATATSPPRSSSCRSRLVTLIARSCNGSKVGCDPVREGAADGCTRPRPRQRHRQLG